LLVRAKTVATFRLDPKDFVAGDTSSDRFFGYKILGRGKPLDERAVRRLVTLLLAEESYGPDEKYKCNKDFSFGLRADGPGGPVELNFVYPCNRMSFFRRADGDAKLTPGEYMDPVGDELHGILRDSFSGEKALDTPR
jgi:hypothetical protein